MERVIGSALSASKPGLNSLSAVTPAARPPSNPLSAKLSNQSLLDSPPGRVGGGRPRNRLEERGRRRDSRVDWWRGRGLLAREREPSDIAFASPRGFEIPSTRVRIRLLGPCFKTGQANGSALRVGVTRSPLRSRRYRGREGPFPGRALGRGSLSEPSPPPIGHRASPRSAASGLDERAFRLRADRFRRARAVRGGNGRDGLL